MIRMHCDGCSREIPPKSLRYTVTIDVRAAYDELEIGLNELVQDHRKELMALIERLKDQSAEAIESSVYKKMQLDLCPNCQKAYLQNPLRFHPERVPEEPGVDIDAFLRSLGFGDS